MDARNSRFAIKLLPSLTDFAFLMPIVFLFGRMNGTQNLLGDCDTGWHIRTGQWIASNHAVPVHDLFSFSKPNGVWYAWEWLSDLLFAWLNAHGGLAAVSLAAILIISATFTILFRLSARQSNVILAIVITMIAAVASSIHWLARPHLFTMLFLVLFCAALEGVREGRTKLLWILPPATALWTNLHGGWVAGIVTVAAYATGELLKAAFDPEAEARRAALLRARRYAVCAAACLAATLINPYTYHLHQHVLAYLTDPYQAQHIMEFLSISFHHPIAIFFEFLLLAGAAAAFHSFQQGTYIEAVVILAWAHAALLAARNIPLFAIVATPPISATLAAWFAGAPESRAAQWVRTAARKFNAIAAETSATDRIARWHVPSFAGAALVAALLFAPHPPKRFRPEFDPKAYPVSAVSKIAADVLGAGRSAHIFTYDQWGDYLIYRLYPRTRVFIDGRSDYYGADFETKYLDAVNVKYGWEDTLARFGVDTVLLPPSMPLTGALKISKSWRLIYDDGVALVFRSTAAPAVSTALAAVGDMQASPAPAMDRGKSRDREVTKTEASDPAIAESKSTT